MKTIKPQKLGVLCKTLDSGDAYHFAVSVLVLFPFTSGGGSEPPPLLPEVALWKLAAEELGGEILDEGVPKQRGEVLVTGAAQAPGGPRRRYAPRVAIGTVDKTVVVEAPDDSPPPAGLGPVDVASPERAAKAGTYDEAWRKERYPGFPADMDWSLFNVAPEDQQIDGYFHGDEAFVVEQMHPEVARLEGTLPRVRARAFITHASKSGEAFVEIAMRLDTVRLLPRAERGILIFHGMREVAEDDGADVVHLVLGCEDLGAPKPVDHYRDVLAQRLDRERGHLRLLQDGDLLPAPRGPAPARPEDTAEKAAFANDGLLQKNMRRKLELAHAQARQRMIALGVDPAQVDLPPLPPDEPPPDLDDPAVIEKAMAEGEAAKEDAERKKAEADRQFRATCTARGLDPDEALKDAEAKAGGPPQFSADEELGRVREVARQAKAHGTEVPEIDAALADGSLEAGLRAAEQQVRQGYLKFAHHYPAAARLDGEAAARVRQEVAEGCRAGRSFAGRDLTGADLSGLDLRKGNFRGAMLEGADLTGAELRGADFTDAVLARADLTRANLFAAKLAGANLGSAKLHDADASGADLAGAVLVKADLSGACFQDAELPRADLSEAILTRTDLTRAKAPEATFIKTDLSSAVLGGADLSDCNFIEVDARGADFTGAKLRGAVFFAARGDGAVFSGADLENLRVVQGSSFEGASYRGARLDSANLRGTRLARSDFGGARLHGADLSESDLHGAIFLRADARGARFVRADLTAADMRSINLMEGSLSKAILHGADLRRANLFRVDFARARTDQATNLTDANVKRMRVVAPRGAERGPSAPR